MALVRCVTEMGMGVDVHGLDYTLAATRAVFDAIHHSSLGFARLVGATADEMIVNVLIGVPHPEKVQIDVVVKAIDGTGRSGPYHISSGSDYSIKELFDATLAALGIQLEKPVEVRPRAPDDVYTILIDPSKTNQDFAWKTKTPLATGVKKAIEYYREFGVAQTFTHLRMEDKK